MDTARIGAGDTYSKLAPYIREYGRDRSKWPADKIPHCPDCGATVHGYGMDAAVTNARAQSHAEITGRKPENKIGWHHDDKKAGAECPQDFSKDQRFEHLTRLKYNPALRLANEQLLSRPDIAADNLNRLKKLLHLLTWRQPTDDEVKAIDKDVRKKYAGTELARLMPEMLPVLAVLSMKPFDVKSGGKTKKYVFKSVGLQKINFIDSQGREFVQTIPKRIQVHTAYRPDGGAYAFAPHKKPIFAFEISPETLRVLAKLPYDAGKMNRAIGSSSSRDLHTLSLFEASKSEVGGTHVASKSAYKPWMHDEPRQPMPSALPFPTATTAVPEASKGLKPAVSAADDKMFATEGRPDFQLTAEEPPPKKVTRARIPSRNTGGKRPKKVHDSQSKLGLE